MLNAIFDNLLGSVTIGSLEMPTVLFVMYVVFVTAVLALGGFIAYLLVKHKDVFRRKNEETSESTEEIQQPFKPAAPTYDNIPQQQIDVTTVQLPEAIGEDEIVDLQDVPVANVSREDNYEDPNVKYNKSFVARLIQAEDQVKDYYDQLKSQLLSYKGVKNRISWKHETFRKGRTLLAKIAFRGKLMRVYFHLNPADYVDSKYKVDDVSNVKANAETPCAYAIKNDRRCRYAKELIEATMNNFELVQLQTELVRYSEDYPFDTTDNLVKRKLIKIVTSKSNDQETEDDANDIVQIIASRDVRTLMTDEEALKSIKYSARHADKTKVGIVNVDTLSQTFEAGENITVKKIQKRIAGFSKITYVKVLARGIIDKPLIVEADEFSLDAVKMIVLAGGQVYRTLK